MKNLTWQNPEQLFVAQELINKVKSKCCGIKDDKKEYSNFDTTKIGKRFRRKYKPHESEMEVTKDFFDWLHQLSDEWKITELESEKIEDHDSSDFDPFWLYW